MAWRVKGKAKASGTLDLTVAGTAYDVPFTVDVNFDFDEPLPTAMEAALSDGEPIQGVYDGETKNVTAVGIQATNSAPTAVSIPDQSLNVNEAFSLDLSVYFSDPDGDTLTYSTASTLPAGITLSGSVLSGTPTSVETQTIVMRAADPDGELVDSAGFEIDVTQVALFDLNDLNAEFWIDGASLVDKSVNGRDAVANSAGETPSTTVFGIGNVAAFAFNQSRLNVTGLPTSETLTYGFVGQHTGANTSLSIWGGPQTFLPLALSGSTSTSFTRVSNNNDHTGRRVLTDGQSAETIINRGQAYTALATTSLMLITVPAGSVASWIGGGDSASYYLDGPLAAAFVISGDLTEIEIQKIQGYAAHTYGFSLPFDHPYVDEAPTDQDPVAAPPQVVDPNNPVIFETNFDNDTGFYLTGENAPVWARDGASVPNGWDGMQASGVGSLETVPNGLGGNAMKFEWDATNPQPLLRLIKHLSNSETQGYDDVYIRYRIKLPDSIRFGPARDYWKWGRLWQNVSPDANDASVTENKPDSGYVVWQCGSGQGFTRFASYWQDDGPSNSAGLGSAGGESQITNFFQAGADVNSTPGYFEAVGSGAWDIDDNGDMTNTPQEFQNIEFHFKLASSPTSNDGVFEMFINGELWDYQTLDAAQGAAIKSGIPTDREGSGWNMFILFDNMGGWNSEWDQIGVDGFVLMDDVVVSREPIGHTYVAGNTNNAGAGAT